MQAQKINFFAPIKEFFYTESKTEQGFEQKDFTIKGTAINETTTRNGTTFLAEELAPSAASLRNKPLLKDHNNSVDSIIGRTTENVNYDMTDRSIKFEAKIMDKNIQEKVAQGLITNVSIGAMVKNVEYVKDDDGNVKSAIVRGIDFVELSLVAVPADPNAGFARAIMESFSPSPSTTLSGAATSGFLQGQTITLSESSAPVLRGADHMAEEQSTVALLLAEKAKLQEELAALEVQKLKQQKDIATLEVAKLEAQQKSINTTSDQTKGTVTQTTTPTTQEEVFELGLSETGRGMSINADYNKIEGVSRLNSWKTSGFFKMRC